MPAYIGLPNGKLGVLERMYVGTDKISADHLNSYGSMGKGRLVRKAFVGVNGKSFQWYPKLQGTIEPLSEARYDIGATKNNKYAFFGQGTTSGKLKIDAYNSDLIRFNPIAAQNYDLSASSSHFYTHTGNGEWAFLSNGTNLKEMSCYNSNLTKFVLYTFGSDWDRSSGSYVGNYSIFLNYYSSSTDCCFCISNDLTISTITKLSQKVSSQRVNLKDYAIFRAYSGAYNITDICFDSNLTKTNLTSFSPGGSYSFCSGGNKNTHINHQIGLFNSGGYNQIFHVYNKDLISSIFDLKNYFYANNSGTTRINSTTVGNFAIYLSNSYTSSLGQKYMTIIDRNITASMSTDMNYTHVWGGATHIGNYAIFAGGNNKNKSSTTGQVATVDVFDRELRHYHS